MFTLNAQNLAGILRQVSEFNSPDNKQSVAFSAMVHIEDPTDHQVPIFLDDVSPMEVFSKSFRGTVDLLKDTSAMFALHSIEGFVMQSFEGSATVARSHNGKLDMYFYTPQLELGNSLLQYMFFHEMLCTLMEGTVGSLSVFSSNATVKKRLVQDAILHETPAPNGERFAMMNKAPRSAEEWLQDASLFLEDNMVIGLRDQFFRRVAVPMFMAAREENPDTQLEILSQCKDTVWGRMSNQWLIRKGAEASGEEA